MTLAEASELLRTCAQRVVASVKQEYQFGSGEWVPIQEVACWTSPDGSHTASGNWEGNINGETVSCTVLVGNTTFTGDQALQLWHCAARFEYED